MIQYDQLVLTPVWTEGKVFMLIDLDGPTIVGSFKQKLHTFTFIPTSDIPDISNQLDKLIDPTTPRRRTTTTVQRPRSHKTEAAIWLWDYFLNRALNSITTNTRGYHDLSAYFREYAHYENLLFSIDENHRDHVIHSIWVMMIGFYLTDKCRPFSHLYLIPFSSVESSVEHSHPFQEAGQAFFSKQDVLWVLISLTHDLGYPIQKTTVANHVMSNMISNFGFLTQTDFSYQFTVLHQTAIDELLNTISTMIVWLPNGSYKMGISPGNRLDYAKSFERLDHGIMSAYLLQRHLDFICDTMSSFLNVPDYTEHDTQTAALRALIIMWLIAISDHTNINRYYKDPSDISVLLVISDELDEFSRYAHHKTRDTWVTVRCTPRVNCTTHSLDFVYDFVDRTPGELLSFFKNKVSRLIHLFDLDATLVREISIKCSNSTPHSRRNLTYYFERRFDSGYGFVKKSYGGSTTDVIGFLNGAVNLN